MTLHLGEPVRIYPGRLQTSASNTHMSNGIKGGLAWGATNRLRADGDGRTGAFALTEWPSPIIAAVLCEPRQAGRKGFTMRIYYTNS